MKRKYKNQSLLLFLGALLLGIYFYTGAYPDKNMPQDLKQPSKEVQKTLKKMQPIMEAAEKAPDKQSIFLYSKEFAQRFHLDEKKAINLGEGLLAMELIIVKDKMISDAMLDAFNEYGKRSQNFDDKDLVRLYRKTIDLTVGSQQKRIPFRFRCYLHVYVKNELPIQYPFKSQMIIDNNRTMKYVMSIGSIEGMALRSIYDYSKNPNFISPSYPKDYGSSRDLNNSLSHKVFISKNFQMVDEHGEDLIYNIGIQFYKKNIVPGINIISYGSFGSYEVGRIIADGQLYLQKTNTPYLGVEDKPGYFLNDLLKKEYFFVFPFPKEIRDWAPLKIAIERENGTFLYDKDNNLVYPNF